MSIRPRSVAVPPDILDKIYAAQPLDDWEQSIFAFHCVVGHDLLVKIPRLEHVADMVAAQRAYWRGTDDSSQVGVGASLLKVAVDFDEQIMRGCDVPAALSGMLASGRYNALYLTTLQQAQVEVAQKEALAIRVAELRKELRPGGRPADHARPGSIRPVPRAFSDQDGLQTPYAFGGAPGPSVSGVCFFPVRAVEEPEPPKSAKLH